MLMAVIPSIKAVLESYSAIDTIKMGYLDPSPVLWMKILTLLFHHSLFVALVTFSFYIAYISYFHPLSRIPTLHWSVPLSRFYYLYTIFSHRRRITHLDAHNGRDGTPVLRPVIRVGPQEVSIMTTDGIKIAFEGGFERTSWYSAFKNWG